MKTFFGILALVVASLFSVPAYAQVTGKAALPLPAAVKQRLNDSATAGPSVRLGSQLIDKKIQLLRALYDYDKQGGATTAFSVKLKDINGGDAVLPKGALVTKAIVHVHDTVTSGVNVSLGLNSSNDLLNASASSGFTSGARIAGIPVGSAATSVVAAAERAVTASFSGSVAAGKFSVFLEYYISD